MRTVDVYEAKLCVTPDNTTPGSEGRLFLQLPDEFKPDVGKMFKVVGKFNEDDAVLFLATHNVGRGHSVTSNLKVWWKNGVRDHGIRRNHLVRVWVLDKDLWVVQVLHATQEPPPDFPPRQDMLFA